jgi:hypothetical protein
MGVVDWRAWTDQNGGTLPTAPNPPGTPWQENQMFPGVGPIPDLVSGVTSVPPTPSLAYPSALNVPQTVNAIDPFYVGAAYPNGGGWNAVMERFGYTVGSPTTIVAVWPAGSAGNPGWGAGSPAGPIQRPVVPGVTS